MWLDSSENRARYRSLLAALFTLALTLSSFSPAQADEMDLRVREVARSLQCPVCQSVNVADSTSELAADMRAVIRKKLEAGESREQIIAYFVERYGESVLTDPPKRGASLVIWLVPLFGIGVGGALIYFLVRSWRQGNPEATPVAVAPEASPGDLKRYEERVRRELEEMERS